MDNYFQATAEAPTEEVAIDTPAIAFFFAVTHDHFDYLEETMKEYSYGEYIIAAETAPRTHLKTKGQHFHFVVQMSVKDYHKFSKRVKTKFDLQGQAKNGVGHQYGKVRNIRDIEKLKAYVCKHHEDDLIRSNIAKDKLLEYFEKSFIKEDKLTAQAKLFKELDKEILVDWFVEASGYDDPVNYRNAAMNYNLLAVSVIKYFIVDDSDDKNKDKPLPAPSVIKKYIIEYIRTIHFDWDKRARLIYLIMEIRNPFRQ